MQIRFFATNRDRQVLSRLNDYQLRIRLQKYDYHWVDMKKYMAYYMATTNPSSMPSEVIIENSEKTVFTDFICKKAVKNLIIGIHGFNVPFHGALTSFSILADTLRIALEEQGTTLITDPEKNNNVDLDDPSKNVTAFVGFSWPSNGIVFDYESDRQDAEKSAPALANLISNIRSKNPQLKIHIIAHSLGNYLVCNMLDKVFNQVLNPVNFTHPASQTELETQDKGHQHSFFIDRYIMLAPDVERREVTQCNINTQDPYTGQFYEGLKKLVEQTDVFYSRYDKALLLSIAEKETFRESFQRGIELLLRMSPDLKKRWESSLGLNPLPALAPENMYSHNATALTNRPIDHGDYFDASAVMKKIAEIIMKVDQTTLVNGKSIPNGLPQTTDAIAV